MGGGQDGVQAGSLFEALTLNSMSRDLGLAWMEAWDRGPHWGAHLSAGLKRVTPGQKDFLRHAVIEATKEENKSARDYGFVEETHERKNTAATP
jgi:hypothetical protein